jgi:hypothetical protein
MMPAVFRFEDRPFDPFGATTPREARAWNGSPAREVTSIRSEKPAAFFTLFGSGVWVGL